MKYLVASDQRVTVVLQLDETGNPKKPWVVYAGAGLSIAAQEEGGQQQGRPTFVSRTFHQQQQPTTTTTAPQQLAPSPQKRGQKKEDVVLTIDGGTPDGDVRQILRSQQTLSRMQYSVAVYGGHFHPVWTLLLSDSPIDGRAVTGSDTTVTGVRVLLPESPSVGQREDTEIARVGTAGQA